MGRRSDERLQAPMLLTREEVTRRFTPPMIQAIWKASFSLRNRRTKDAFPFRVAASYAVWVCTNFPRKGHREG
jgi:hypothetical protein